MDRSIVNARAYFYLAITSLFWGGNSVAGKMAVGHVSPMMLTTLRWTVALENGGERTGEVRAWTLPERGSWQKDGRWFVLRDLALRGEVEAEHVGRSVVAA